MTKLGFLNKFIIQFFFIRLTRHTQKVRIAYIDYARMKNYRTQTEQWYSIQYWVVPFTGWSNRNDFKYLNGQHFLPLTKPKAI